MLDMILHIFKKRNWDVLMERKDVKTQRFLGAENLEKLLRLSD